MSSIKRIGYIVADKAQATLDKRWFFYVIVGLLVVQAAWIALTARYPQAFDENFHFELIELHAQQWLPFFTYQPPNAAVHGAVIHDPSYLYHYVLSIPYRLLVHVTSSETTQIIVLRFINIGLFVAGLFAYRRLLVSELKLPRRLSHTALLFFVVAPVVPLLAGQINYDNMIFAVCGLLLVYVTRYIKALSQITIKTSGQISGDSLIKKPDQTSSDTSDNHSKRLLGQTAGIPLLLVIQILAIGSLGCIIQFSFVPIMLATITILTYITLRAVYVHKIKLQNLYSLPLPSRRYLLVIYAFLAIIAIGLCLERYGTNLVLYHSPVPACDKVLSIDECQSYAPWARDYLFAETYPHPNVQGMLAYPLVWIHRIVYETLFTITSYNGPNGTVLYTPEPPLTTATYTAWISIVIAVGAAIYYRKKIMRRPALSSLLLICSFYCLILFIQNFLSYRHTGEVVAVHGRYLVLIYPLLYAVLLLGLSQLMQHFKLERYKIWLVAGVFVLFMQGGGFVTWIVRSDPSWYWQQSQPAAHANRLAKDVLDKLVF